MCQFFYLTDDLSFLVLMGAQDLYRWLTQWLLDRFEGYFPQKQIGLWSPCSCQQHWLLLDESATIQPQEGLCIMAISQALGRVRSLVPEIKAVDRIVDLGPRRSHAVRPKSPQGPPPQKQATCLKPKTPAGPPPTKPKAMPPVLKVEDKPKKPKQPPGPPPGWMSSPKVKALPMVREIRNKADDMETPTHGLRDS